ncbi:MAG: hypothetical protein PUC05_02235 [Firmicutes bacterium]|nr:hypothetical protein [Bacillota bacterium]
MKKSFLVLVMAVMLLSCACSQKELYEGSVVSVAGDGLVKPELVREYSKQFYEYNTEANITVENTVYQCRYFHSERYWFDCTRWIDVYRTSSSDADIYIDHDSGDVVGYRHFTLLTDENEFLKADADKPLENAKAIAIDCASKFINTDEYNIDIREEYKYMSNDTGQEGNKITVFNITFSKYIDGLPSSDMFKVAVNSKGTLISWKAYALNSFDRFSVNIDKDVLEASIKAKLDALYKPIFSSYTYNIDQGRIILTPEGIPVYQANIDIQGNEVSTNVAIVFNVPYKSSASA